jgi:hypothetical protein
VTFALARSLLLADAVAPAALAQALLVSATRGISLVRALLATRAIDPARLEQQLERGNAPTMRHVAPVMSLVQHLPPGLCERLLALPVRRDPRTGTIDVAVVDSRDPHPVEEVAHWLKAPVRMVRTTLVSMDAALRRMQQKPEVGLRALAAPIWVPAEDDGPTEVRDFPLADPNIPFSLTRKSNAPVAIIELGEPTASRDAGAPRRAADSPPARFAETDPVLDLRRRKSVAPGGPPTEGPARSNRADPNAHEGPLPAVGLAAVLQAMQSAGDRDGVLEWLVAGTRPIAPRVAILAVRRDTLVGWTCSPELAERSSLRSARVQISLSDVFSKALDADEPRLIRVPKDATHAPLLAAVKPPTLVQVLVASVRVEGKPVALVLADDFADAAAAGRHVRELAQAAGEALARLLRERRREG